MSRLYVVGPADDAKIAAIRTEVMDWIKAD
jgi:hypothetical protein